MESEYCNIPPSIKQKVNRKLHLIKNHPIEIIKNHIIDYFKSLKDYNFDIFDDLSPYVKIEENFDKLLLPKNHPSRSKSDTYYLNEDTVLRSHTSAHQNELLASGHNSFIVAGDVYRKDEVNATHYPIFHQMEAIGKVKDGVEPVKELKSILNGLIEHLFPGCKYKIRDHHFHFTNPSFEYDVHYNDEWLEVLGCGIMHSQIVKNNNLEGSYWALGLGLDRLCMILSKIPDIRYLWSTHDRFLQQYSDGEIHEFIPFSELQTQTKDISFFIPDGKHVDGKGELGEDTKVWIDENDFFETIREVNGDWIKSVDLKDEFYHKKKSMLSRMYRIVYEPIDPSMNDPAKFTKICNELQDKVREKVGNMDVELR